MNVLTRLLAVLWMSALAAPGLAADRSCAKEWVCIEPVEDQFGNVSFFARNLREFPITVSLRVRGTNLKSGGLNPVTRTVSGGNRDELIRFELANKTRGSGYRYWFDWTVGNIDAAHDEDHMYRLPYADGKRYQILQGFGSRFSHTGNEKYAVDFAMREGTPIHAARSGVVARTESRHDIGCWEDGCGRYANFIVVLHDDGTTGEYYHLKKDGVLVEPGERVERGEHIGYSGNTGHTTVPHLHFAVYRALSWGRTRSVPFVFDAAEGRVEYVRPGRGLTAR